jgi:multisubunit Na+/H+ antiporter MnhC subunit
MVQGGSVWGTQLALDGTNGNLILLAIVIGMGAFAVGLCGLSSDEDPEGEEQV